jgi:spore coat protein H
MQAPANKSHSREWFGYDARAMRTTNWRISAWVIVALLAAAPCAHAQAPAADEFFNADALRIFHFKLTRSAWDQMQPNRGGLFSGLFAATRPAKEEATHDSPFGYHYAYVHADVEYDGRLYRDVGLRFKGNSSYLVARELKKPFKLDVNHYQKEQELSGISSLNFNNNAMDPEFLREAASYEFFRDAGVPASRTTWGLVYLSVESLHDKKLAGLYTLVEEVNKPFLKAHFGSSKGLLLKPENAFNLPYLGDDFAKYKKMYRPKTDGTPATRRRLIELLKLIHQADDATFEAKIDQNLDMPEFLRFIAANALLANMDSFLSTGHNFYLYIHPDTLKAHFIPWDLNLSFGTFDWVGTVEEQAKLSLKQPYVKANLLTERVLRIDRFARAYRAEAERIAKTCLAREHFDARMKRMEGAIAQAEHVANVPHKALPPKLPAMYDLRNFAAARYDSVMAQLTRKDEGYVPYWQKGFIGGRMQRPATRPTTKPVTQPAR